MTTTSMPAPAPAAQHRRVDDMPQPDQPLWWGEDGTPLPESSAIHQYRPHDDRHRLWADIKTHELLNYVQASPQRFELRTLYAMPVDDIALSPNVVVLSALEVIDRCNREGEAAKAKLRAALAALGELP